MTETPVVIDDIQPVFMFSVCVLMLNEAAFPGAKGVWDTGLDLKLRSLPHDAFFHTSSPQYFCTKELSPVTYIESILGINLLMVSMNRRNNYSEENLFQCSFGHLTLVLRQTWKNYEHIL